MRALGRGSVAAALKRILDVLQFLVTVGLGVAAVLSVLAAASYATGGGAMLPGVQIDLDDPWYVTAIAFLLGFGWLGVAWIVIRRLRTIFATLTAGDPFVPENAEHLRVIWIVIAAFELARYAVGGGAAALIMMTGGNAGGLQGEIDLNLSVWFAVLVIIVLAEVFREGARLRQEQRLTI